jgi:hypothetical protein
MHALFLSKHHLNPYGSSWSTNYLKSSHKIPTNQQNKIEKTPIFITHTHLNIIKDYFAL